MEQELKIRRQAGLANDNLYLTGTGIDASVAQNPTDPVVLEKLKSNVKKWVDIAKNNGYKNVYFYGIDEATLDVLKSERLAFNAIREAGGKVFASCWKGDFEVMGDLIDVAVLPGLDKAEAAKYHQIGHQIFTNANPHSGLVQPETYRRNHGLALWLSGYDGSMEFPYQAAYGGSIWNDFDKVRGKWTNNQVFAYPTVDGVIDTIEWEGFREGVDDVRYLTTLLKAIQETDKPELAAAAQAWLDNLNPAGDLDALRADMVSWILKLEGFDLDGGRVDTPLPSTLVLLGSGLLSLVGLRRVVSPD